MAAPMARSMDRRKRWKYVAKLSCSHLLHKKSVSNMIVHCRDSHCWERMAIATHTRIKM